MSYIASGTQSVGVGSTEMVFTDPGSSAADELLVVMTRLTKAKHISGESYTAYAVTPPNGWIQVAASFSLENYTSPPTPSDPSLMGAYEIWAFCGPGGESDYTFAFEAATAAASGSGFPGFPGFTGDVLGVIAAYSRPTGRPAGLSIINGAITGGGSFTESDISDGLVEGNDASFDYRSNAEQFWFWSVQILNQGDFSWDDVMTLVADGATNEREHLTINYTFTGHGDRPILMFVFADEPGPTGSASRTATVSETPPTGLVFTREHFWGKFGGVPGGASALQGWGQLIG